MPLPSRVTGVAGEAEPLLNHSTSILLMNLFYAICNRCSKVLLVVFILARIDGIAQYPGGAGDGGEMTVLTDYLFPASLVYSGGQDDGQSTAEFTASVCANIFCVGGPGDGATFIPLNGYVTGQPVLEGKETDMPYHTWMD